MKIGVGFAVKGVRNTVRAINNKLIKNIKDKQKYSVKEVAAIATQMLKTETDGMKYATGAMRHAIGFKYKAYKNGKVAWVAIGVRRSSESSKKGISFKKFRRGGITPAPSKTLHFVIGGTKPHTLGTSQVRRIGKVTSSAKFIGNRWHSGAKKNDFIGRTFPRIQAIAGNRLKLEMKGLLDN
jgi:hypothetical protein